MNSTTPSAADLREALRQAEAAERQAAIDLAASVEPIYRFTLSPVTDKFDRVFDGSGCTIYKLEGIVLNKEEIQAVGGQVSDGGMRYVFNHLNGRFVMSTGGGRIWLNDGTFGKPFDTEAFEALATYLLEVNIDGGDVTEIVNAARARKA